MAIWAEQLGYLERWLLPAECLSCQQPIADIEGDPLICALCRVRWRRLPQPQCGICGEPAPLGLTCRLCPDWPAGFGPVRSAVRFDDGLRRLMHLFKYHGWSRLAEDFATVMLPLLHDAPPDAVLVPIPVSAVRRRERGYDQAGLVATAIGWYSGMPVATNLLRRIRETGTQTRLSPEARRSNLAGAFLAGSADRPLILVDDVFTTGATLVSAAESLLDAGAPSVRALTVARAEAPLSGVAGTL